MPYVVLWYIVPLHLMKRCKSNVLIKFNLAKDIKERDKILLSYLIISILLKFIGYCYNRNKPIQYEPFYRIVRYKIWIFIILMKLHSHRKTSFSLFLILRGIFKLLHDQWLKEMPLMRNMNSVMLRTSTNYEWNWVKLDFFKLFYQDISKERINWKDRNLFHDEISSSLKTIRTIYWVQKYYQGMIG